MLKEWGSRKERMAGCQEMVLSEAFLRRYGLCLTESHEITFPGNLIESVDRRQSRMAQTIRQ